jgi:hypothetical protein
VEFAAPAFGIKAKRRGGVWIVSLCADEVKAMPHSVGNNPNAASQIHPIPLFAVGPDDSLPGSVPATFRCVVLIR